LVERRANHEFLSSEEEEVCWEVEAVCVAEADCEVLPVEDVLESLLNISKNFWISGSTGSLGAAACAAADWF
jgi:hypothetical protein